MNHKINRPDRADLLSSLVVFLVALPLCMGIAVASGVPPALGLITGIVGGLIVGLLQGSPLQVSGPAAGLVVLVVSVVQDHGLGALGIVVGLAGAMQFVAGLLRGGRWFRAVPPSVVHGMLAGIGVLIFAGQFHVMIDDAPRASGVENLWAIPEALMKAVAADTSLPHREAAGVGVLAIVTILSWLKAAPGRLKTYLPAPLVGVVVASAVANGFGLPIAYVDVPTDLMGSLNIPEWPTLEEFSKLIGPAVAIALLASAETLLCSTAVDKLHSGPRTDYNRELTAQGVGNLVCGAVGALPMTGVIVRSSANVDAGAVTRWSAVLHGVWLLILVGFFSSALTKIPVSVLAAILVFIGARLASPKVIRSLRPYGRGEVNIFLITTIGVVATDLLTGVLLGLGISIGKLLLRLSNLEIEVEHIEHKNDVVIHLRGSATFLRLAEIAETLDSLPPGSDVHVHFDSLEHIDHAILDLLKTWGDQHRARGGDIEFDWGILARKYHLEKLAEGDATEPAALSENTSMMLEWLGADAVAIPEPVEDMPSRMRRELRVPAKFRAVLSYAGPKGQIEVTNKTLDISGHGAFIRTATPPATGTKVHVTIHIDDDQLDFDAVVANRVEPGDERKRPPGVGVEFTDFSAETDARLRTLLDEFAVEED